MYSFTCCENLTYLYCVFFNQKCTRSEKVYKIPAESIWCRKSPQEPRTACLTQDRVLAPQPSHLLLAGGGRKLLCWCWSSLFLCSPAAYGPAFLHSSLILRCKISIITICQEIPISLSNYNMPVTNCIIIGVKIRANNNSENFLVLGTNIFCLNKFRLNDLLGL